ncbi:hypothetical protein L486_02060 [Kwoniella mangroviensis CBS 10435]|uniref:RRM domain-containing protein n=1 Tax=Kwoniella mangroviensis CBS 10435 TaxID=1331196 RepID=A0A1B9IV51_9TREE|nr:hypothetical protein L486_02060 [Kwoniella mangroviensis CBS 10435]
MVDATITKRLHVGGLTPAITTQHIKERFSSFGVVSEIEELGVDALGHPRPFTFLTLSTTPLQLKKCLNILSGSFWRGTQLRLAEAKPKYTQRYTIPTPTVEEKRKVLEKKRKRVESKRGEDVGRLSQDFRLVNSTIAKKKKFWLVDEDEGNGRMVRPLTMRPSHPIGKALVDNKARKTQEGKKRVGGPPGRLRRRVINPIAWGSIYIKGDKLLSITETQNEDEASIQKGEWEFEEVDDSVVDEDGLDEEGRMVVGIWKKRDMNGEIIEESLVRSKKRRVSIGEVDISEYGSEDFGALESGEVDSPLFGNRDLPAKGSESPLFPSRQMDDVHADEEERGDDEISEDGNAVERASSPLFPSRVPDENKSTASSSSSSSSGIVDQLEQQPSSPLFPTRSIETPNDEDEAQQQPPSPLFPVRNDASTAQQASSPLFPTRALKSRSPSPPPQRKPVLTLPSQILASARAERSSALGVLGSLLGDVSPPAKKEKVVWEVYPESDEDDEVEVGRGGSKSAVSEISSVAQKKVREEVLMDKEPELNLDVTVDGDPSSGSTSSSGSGSSSGDSEEGEGMDVDPPAGNEDADASSSRSGSGSGSSSSGSGSGDDDDDEDESSGSSSDSGSDSEEDSDSESDSEDEDEDKATDIPSVPTKPSGLKDMFAPTTSTSTLNFGSTSASAGFSLLANLGEDIELDEEMDIPLPPAQTDLPTGHEQEEDELQPLPLNVSSGRGKIKFDPSSNDLPLFFTLPTEAGPIGGERKGESRNLYNELHIGIPPIAQPEYDQQQEEEEGEEIPNVPLPGFSRQPGENDESMKAKWTNEKLELTQGWKKRFREAKKSKRRKGGEEVE